MRFSLCVFGAALLGIHPTLAQEAVVRVSMSGSGSVRIDGTEMMTFAPGMFLEGWQHRSFSMPANATPMESEARLDGGRVACAAAIEGRDQGFRLTYGMAGEGLLPRALGRVLPGRRTPWVAIATPDGLVDWHRRSSRDGDPIVDVLVEVVAALHGDGVSDPSTGPIAPPERA